MTVSTMTTKAKKNRTIRLWVIAVWLIFWQLAAMLLASEIILASPISVLKTLFALLGTSDFYASVGISLGHILAGFIMGVFLGVAFAIPAYRFKYFYEFIYLPMAVLKASPIASFIILILVWVKAESLSVFIALIMALPIVFTGVYEALMSVDKKLLEMAGVFRVPALKRIRYIYAPCVAKRVHSSLELAFGYCWKAGIAAEIIGLSRGSIGERLYQAKIYLETPSLFAWTLVIVVLSIGASKVLSFLLNILFAKLEGRKLWGK